jgi:hypothetical protein
VKCTGADICDDCSVVDLEIGRFGFGELTGARWLRGSRFGPQPRSLVWALDARFGKYLPAMVMAPPIAAEALRGVMVMFVGPEPASHYAYARDVVSWAHGLKAGLGALPVQIQGLSKAEVRCANRLHLALAVAEVWLAREV